MLTVAKWHHLPDRCQPKIPAPGGQPGYCLKITRASCMSELVDRAITGLTALGGSAAFLEILRR